MMSRLPVEKLSVYAFVALIALFTADLALLFVRGSMYPQAAPPAIPVPRVTQNPAQSQGNLAAIRDRNIFNADGKIPPSLAEKAGGAGTQEEDPEPVPSNLPITLSGTIVHANPARSIATVSGRGGKQDLVAVKVGMVIPDNLATVISIDRSKITFRNNANKRREFIEMKEDSKISFGSVKPVQQGEVLKKSDTDFELKRDDINRLTNNLPELLQQARAVPRMGAGGTIECFNLAEIAKGSIYERLGLKQNDCIKSVNGEKIDSPAKAMELYNALRSSANMINLGIERNGRDDNFQYNITQ